MTLTKTREAIVKEFEKKANFVDERLAKEAISFLSDYVSQALKDYNEAAIRMLEGMGKKEFEYGLEESGYNQALNDIKEELNK